MVNSESMDSSGDGKPKDYVVTQLNGGGGSISVDTHSPSPVTASSVRLRDAMMDYDANETATDVTSSAECATNPTVDSLPETAVTRTVANDNENIRLTTTATDILQQCESNQSSLYCSVPLVKIQDVLTSYSVDSSGDEINKVNKKLVTRKFLCLYCDRTFVTSNLRQKHVDRCHSVKQARRSSARFQPKFSTACIFCKKLNNTDHNLDDLFKHLVERHSNKYFACVSCEERFLFKSHLEEHNVQNHPKKEKKKLEDVSKFNDVVSDVITDETVEISTIKTKHKTKIKKDESSEREEDSNNRPNLRMGIRKELRKKKVGVKSTKTGVKRNTRFQTKVTNAQGKSMSSTSSSSTRKSRNIKTRHEKVIEPIEKPSSSINPYPTFDAFFRVKKITDHSIDNLKISHLTFDDVFDKAFYTRIKCNIQENLQNHIDGKLFKNEESESRISNFEKNQGVNSSLAENFGCDISLNAATPVVSLLSSQLGEDLESQIEYGAKASKKKPPPKKDEVHYKYFTRRKYQASILENKENRDLSKLDMWTQLVVKDRQQQIINDKKTDKEKIEYTKGIEYRTKMQNAELNRILDRRGPFEDLKEEANKKAAFDKYHKLGENVNCEAISDVTSILTDLIDQVFDYRDHTVKIEDEPIDDKPQISDSDCEIPFYLNLRRNSTLLDQPDIDKSDRITLICSSQETENFEETISPRDKNSLVELSGEWTRARIYICAACGVKVPNIKLLIDHKSVYHQNVWVQHYEFVGNQSVLYRHLSIPILGKVGYFEKYPLPKTWRRSDARLCTKCTKMCNTLGELHRHILECGEDWSWMLARRKLKYRPFGTKSRRKRRGLVKRIIHKEKSSGDEVTEKKKYNIKRYEKPSDAETIQRMLANLPAKRATRKLICLKDGFPKQRKPTQNLNNSSINPPKLSKAGRKKASISNLTKQTLSATNGTNKRGHKCNPMILRKSLRNINKVFGTKILDSNSTLLVKRKLKNVLQHQRITRARKMLIEDTTNDKKEETPSDTGKKEGLLNKMKMLTKAVKKTVLKRDENTIESGINKTSKTRNLKQSDSIEDKINDIMNSIDEGDNSISDNKKEITKNKAEEVEETSSNSLVSKKKPKLMKKESIGSKLVRTLSLRKMRKKNTEEEKLKTQSNPELNAKLQDDKVKNGKRKSPLDSFKNKIKKIKLKDRNVPQIVQVDGSSQISDEILPFLEKIHINSDEITGKVNEIDENTEEEPNIVPSTSTEVTESTEVQELESEVENLENSKNLIEPSKCSSPITEINTEDDARSSTNINEDNPSTSANMEEDEEKEEEEEEEETIPDNHSESEAPNINSEFMESSQIENQPIKIENCQQSDSESKISTDSKISSSSKSKAKKKTKGLNDCIAMLTSKLKQQVDEEPPIVNLPSNVPEIVQNISANENISEKAKPKQIAESIVRPQVINQIPHPEILLQPKLAELNHKIFKANLEKLEKERQDALNLQTRFFLEQQQLFLQQLQMQLPIAPIANPYAYIPNIPKEANFLINNIMLSNQKELGEKFLQNEGNLSKFLGNFDKNKFKEVDVNIEIDIMKCLGGAPENCVPKNDKSKSKNDNRRRQSNKIGTSKRTNKKKENIDLINDTQNIKVNERLIENFSATNTITPEKTDFKLKSSELIKDDEKVIDLKVNKRLEELRIPGEPMKNHFIPNLNPSQPIKFLNASNEDVIDLKIKKNINKEKNLLEELSKNGLSISLFPTNDKKVCEVFNRANLDLQIKKFDTRNHHPNIKNLLSSTSVQFGSIPKVGNALYDNEQAIDLIMNKRSDQIGVFEEETKVADIKLQPNHVIHFVSERDVPPPNLANDSNLLPLEVKIPKRPGRKKKVQKMTKSKDQNVTKIESLETNKNTVSPINENDKIIDLKINKENAKISIPDLKLFAKLEEVPKVPNISPKSMVVMETKINKKSQKKKNSKSQNQYPQIEEVKLNKFNMANILEKEKSISKKVILKPPQFIPSNILRPPILDLQNLKMPINTEILNVPSQETILINKMMNQDGDKMRISNQPEFKIKPLFVEEREPDILEEKSIEKPCFLKLDAVKVDPAKEIDNKVISDVKIVADIQSVPSTKSDTDSEDDMPLAKLVKPPKILETILEESNLKSSEKEVDVVEEVSKEIPKESDTFQENRLDVSAEVGKNTNQNQVRLKNKQLKSKDIKKQLKSKIKKKVKSKNVQKLTNSSDIRKLEPNLEEIQSKLEPDSKEIPNQFESNLQEIRKQTELNSNVIKIHFESNLQEVQKQPQELELNSQKIPKPLEPNSEIKKHLRLTLQEIQDQLIFNSRGIQKQIEIKSKEIQNEVQINPKESQFQLQSKEIHIQPDPKETGKEPESITEETPKQFEFISKEAQKLDSNIEDTQMPLPPPFLEEIQNHEILDGAQKDTHLPHDAQSQPNLNSDEAQKDIELNLKDAQREILSNQILSLLPVVSRDDIQTNPEMQNKVTETEEAVKTNKNKIRVRKRPDDKKEKPKKIPKSKAPPLLEECIGENGSKTTRKIKISCQIFQRSSKIVLDTNKILDEVENEEEEEKLQEVIPIINNVIIKQEQIAEPVEDVDLPPANAAELVQEIPPVVNPVAPIEMEIVKPVELREEPKRVESAEPKLLRIKQELPEIEDVPPELTQETHEEFFETPPIEAIPPICEVESDNFSPSTTDWELEIRRRIKLSNLQLKREVTEDTLMPVTFNTDFVYNVDSPRISYDPEGENVANVYQSVINNEENHCLNTEEISEENILVESVDHPENNLEENNINLLENKMSESTYNIKINTVQNANYNPEVETVIDTEITPLVDDVNADPKLNEPITTNLKEINQFDTEIEDDNREFQNVREGNLPTETANVTPKVLEEHKQITPKDIENKPKKSKKKHEDKVDIPATYGEFQVNTEQTGTINKLKISRKKLPINCDTNEGGISGDNQTKSIDIYVVKKIKKNHKKSLSNKERKRKKSSGSLKENQNDTPIDIENRTDLERSTNFLDNFDPIDDSLLENVEFEVQNEEIGRKLKINKKKIKDKEAPMTVTAEILAPPKTVIAEISIPPMTVNAEISAPPMTVIEEITAPPISAPSILKDDAPTTLSISSNFEKETPVDNTEMDNIEIVNSNEQITDTTENIEEEEENAIKDYDDLPKDMEIEDFEVDRPIIETQFHTLPLSSVMTHTLTNIPLEPVTTCAKTSKKGKKRSKNNLCEDAQSLEEDELPLSSILAFNNSGLKDFGKITPDNVTNTKIMEKFDFANESASYQSEPNLFSINNYLEMKNSFYKMDQTSNTNDLFGKTGSIISNIRSNISTPNTDFILGNSSSSNSLRRGRLSKNKDLISAFNFDQIDAKTSFNANLCKDDFEAKSTEMNVEISEDAILGGTNLKKTKKSKISKNVSSTNFENQIDINVLGDKEMDVAILELETQNSLDRIANTNKISKKRGKKSKDLEQNKDLKMNMEADGKSIEFDVEIPENAFEFTSTPAGKGRKSKDLFKNKDTTSTADEKIEPELVQKENFEIDEVDAILTVTEIEMPTLKDKNLCLNESPFRTGKHSKEFALTESKLKLNEEMNKIGVTETSTKDVYDFCDDAEFEMTAINPSKFGKELYDFKDEDLKVSSKKPRRKNKNLKSPAITPDLKLTDAETNSSINSFDLGDSKSKKQKKSKNMKSKNEPPPTASSTFDTICDELQALCDVPLELTPISKEIDTNAEIEFNLNEETLLNKSDSTFCDNVKTSCDAKIDELLKEITFSPKSSKKSKRGKIVPTPKPLENEDAIFEAQESVVITPDNTSNLESHSNSCIEEDMDKNIHELTDNKVVEVENIERFELPDEEHNEKFELPAPPVKSKPPRSRSPKKKMTKGKKERALSNESIESYCDICDKMFARSENLIKHKRTLTHIAKLSELEAKEALAKTRDNKIEQSEEEQFKMDINISNILNTDKQCEQEINDDITNKIQVNSPFVLNTNSDTLKLADIINEVLNKPVENDKHNPPYATDSQMSSQTPNSITTGETKRYKSLGERKSFESDLKTTPTSSYQFNTIQINNSDTVSTLPNPDTILKHQISILENIIETEGPFGYIDDISVSSNKSIEESMPKSPSELSIMSEANKQDDSNQTFNHNANMMSTLVKPSSHNDQFIKPTQYEEISNDSSTVRNQFDDQRSRKVLNRDEELFLECCSLLKSSSEVSGYSKRSSKTVHVLNNFEMKQSDEPDWLERKNFAAKNQDFRQDIFSTSCPNTPLGDGYAEDYSNTNSNTIATDWSTKQREQRQQENPVFEDISLDSKGSVISKQEMEEQFKNVDRNFGDFQLFNTERQNDSKEDGEVKTGEDVNEKDVDEDFKKKMVSRFGGLMAKAWKNSMQVVKKTKNKKKQGAEVTQTSITDYAVPLTTSKVDNDFIDSKKMLTKGAMKVFEGLKVSIPTDDLDMKELLNNSHSGKKQEQEINKELSEKLPIPNEIESIKEDEKISKNIKNFGNRLGLKVTKKKPNIKNQELSILGGKTGPMKEDDSKKGHDVYDFEETQDNTDIFNSKLTNIKEFRSQIAEKKTLTSDVITGNKEPSAVDPEESDNESRGGLIDSFGFEAQSLSSLSTESSSSAKKPKKKNITKKKCMIMGRIFKNAFKSKVEEDIRDIPLVDNSKLVEDYVMHLPSKEEKRSKLTEEEMDLLFDKLLEDKTVDEADKDVVQSKENPQALPSNKVEKVNSSKIKTKAPLKRKRVRHNSESTDDEFSLNKNKKRYTKKKQKNVDNAINLEQELKECIGVASRKSQRKCTSGKQNILVEFWSSDDSNFEAFIRETAMDKPNEELKDIADEVKELEDILDLKKAEVPKGEEPFKELVDTIKKATPKIEIVNQKATNPITLQEASAPKPEKLANLKQARRKSSNIKHRPKNIEDDVDNKKKNAKTTAETLAANRRKRAASNTLYYWSSSSEDESRDLIEIKPVRDEVDEDDEDRPMQHGWIVGDSPKKLVTMLAQAKGKKVDADSVKEQGKKRTTM